jgi:hypothetical protein
VNKGATPPQPREGAQDRIAELDRVPIFVELTSRGTLVVLGDGPTFFSPAQIYWLLLPFCHRSAIDADLPGAPDFVTSLLQRSKESVVCLGGEDAIFQNSAPMVQAVFRNTIGGFDVG